MHDQNDGSGKTCTKCGLPQPLSMFGVDKQKPDGLRSHCRDCRRKEAKAYHSTPMGKEVVRAAMKKYLKTEKGRAQRRRADHTENSLERREIYRKSERGLAINRTNSARQRERHPERVSARNAVCKAVMSGKLPPASSLPCCNCGNAASEYHHHRGYSRESRLDVLPICKGCHEKTHVELRQAA